MTGEAFGSKREGGVGWAGKASWQQKSQVLWSATPVGNEPAQGILSSIKEGPRNLKPRSWDSDWNVTSVFHIPDSGNSSVYFWWWWV